MCARCQKGISFPISCDIKFLGLYINIDIVFDFSYINPFPCLPFLIDSFYSRGGDHVHDYVMFTIAKLFNINGQLLASINYNLPFQSLIQSVITVSCLFVIVSPTQNRHLVELLMS